MNSRNWRRLILIRDCVTHDGHRYAACVMCNRINKTYALQAHHIYPKSLYPELALELWNGVCLDVSCHMQIVHGGNSFLDMSLGNWRKFVPMFKRYTSLAKQRDFNGMYQDS